MNYLDYFKKFTQISYLPKFSILHFNNFTNTLYLPNLQFNTKLLGKWNSDWYSEESYLLGHLEQDEHKNVIFHICSYFICEKSSNHLNQIDKDTFCSKWNSCYTHDLHIMPFFFDLHSEYFKVITTPKVIDIPTKESIVVPKEKEPIMETIEKQKEPVVITIKEEPNGIYKKYMVCKTDKPEIYHVYDNGQYLSTCLIPNIKTSKYMNDVFESKSINEFVEMKLKLNEKSNKWIPII